MSVWDQLVGQEQVISTLRQAALAGQQLVSFNSGEGIFAAGQKELNNEINNRALSHAWLFTGPPGSGRSTTALAFAAALQCENESEPGCGQCSACHTVLAKTHADVTVVSTERVIIKMEEIENLVELSQQAPSGGKWRIILIEDADRMVERTSNLLLKAIEEPPERTIWILCTPQAQDVLITIRSRCRILTLNTPSVNQVVDLLVKKDGLDPEVAKTAAALSQCHIGVARHLASDPSALEQRRKLLLAPLEITSLAEAMFVANDLVEGAKSEAEASCQVKDAQEKASLLKTLGADPEGKVPPQFRAQVKALEEDQKRRAKRMTQDVLDRLLIDLMGFYRDVFITQTQAKVDLINLDLTAQIEKQAQAGSPEQSMLKIEAIKTARKRLTSNVPPLLTMEALFTVLLAQ